ncbi:MAG: preprotein translocase subunit SecG [Alphaproteobacteria bacterium]|nr:preprotein translocase subunit SecG [Alphaproteobacteria bacterium]
MQNILIIFQLFVSIALVGAVLLQRSEGGALGMGGSGSGLGGLFSARGAADTLTRTTAILAALFFLTSLALTLLALHSRPQSRSILDQQASPGRIQPLTLPHPSTSPAKPAPQKVPAPH